MERALELNPTDLSINRNYAQTLLCARQYDKAVEQARKTYERKPDFILSKTTLGLAYLAKSMYQEILELYENDEESGVDRIVDVILLAKNNREEAVRILDESANRFPGFEVAFAYAKLGEADKVYELLERAYKNHESDLGLINILPSFEQYHSDPCFQALLKKMGLD